LWCGEGHLHWECPERKVKESTPRCCNCNLIEGEKLYPTSYRGCSHAKEEHNELQGNLWKDVRLYVHVTTAVIRNFTESRQTAPTTTSNADRAAVPVTKGISENASGSTGS
jgi:hypothetical protein